MAASIARDFLPIASAHIEGSERLKLIKCSLVFLVCLAHDTSGASPLKNQFIETDDHVHLSFLQTTGQDSSSDILLISGWSISASIWSKQLTYFGDLGYRVVALDSRSQGKSTIVSSGNSPERRAKDISQTIARLHLKHVVLLGWSQGVQDVAAYIHLFGEKDIRGVVLVDSPVSSGPSDITENAEFAKAILSRLPMYTDNPRAYLAGMMDAIIQSPAEDKMRASLTEEGLKTPPDIGVSMLIQDMFTLDRRPYLNDFVQPTLVIAADGGPLQEMQKRMAESIRGASFVTIGGAGHALFVDKPEQFNQVVLAFLQRLEKSTGVHDQSNP
jgi:microsomal epoxide hydrolase